VIRLRIYRVMPELPGGWAYEIRDTRLPDNHQIRSVTFARDWPHALADGLRALHRAYQRDAGTGSGT